MAGYRGQPRRSPDYGDAQIRQALGDPARAPRFVETVHGRGYRFVAPVAETNATHHPGT